MVTVIKIGGSLAEDPNSLINLCKELIIVSKKYGIIIVPGGGKFADTVRYLYDKFKLSDEIAHRMAILAMDQYGLLLKDMMKEAILTYSLKDALKVSKRGILSIILPSKIMLSLDSLEHSWRVTSDSISAFIASSLKAEKLILAKDVDGIFTADPKRYDVKMFEKISASKLLKEKFGCVDEFLPRILIEKKLICYVVNGKSPDRVKSIVEGKRDIYTKINPC
ncbi:MAG: delta 1-pyrroline-5-carboxylate synthetase [archaeon]|nr:delta 1-pyrroline-5-carboxylate synthetase [archaeon]MCP8314456.1 delta 1-pyrroline-5-carboxylate synthetase [archaeon]MCP8317529.1 delta 1-pyrroline-5-carboxylate synthetase [archaeon]MCP8319985.1 delta 1-pyrroline-5-carboxylate synthetase [archaeon]